MSTPTPHFLDHGSKCSAVDCTYAHVPSNGCGVARFATIAARDVVCEASLACLLDMLHAVVCFSSTGYSRRLLSTMTLMSQPCMMTFYSLYYVKSKFPSPQPCEIHCLLHLCHGPPLTFRAIYYHQSWGAINYLTS